ncbi:MAG: SusC/RagA family TonB-linked outer membrane protein [Bacteroidales bacterium]
MKYFLLCLSLLLAVTTEAQTRSVSGVVTDKEAGEPLVGVTVFVEGSNVVTITDADGGYALSVPNDAETLSFTFIGYKKATVGITGGKVFNVSMESEATTIEEVVVTGYQKIDRKLFTGSASVVKSEDAIIDGEADVSRMLQGKAAGVQVQNVSGTFGASPKIRVRGASSIYGDSKPLWVVDGVVLEDVVEVSADDLASGNAVTLIGSAVAGLNADDIESFQILKDASATALYGARAMNGVIIITTKKGRKGEVRINYSLETTMRTKPRYSSFDIMNSQEQMGVYLDMQSKGLLNHSDIVRAADGGVFNRMYNLINSYDPTTGFGLANTPEARNAFLRSAEMRNTDWFDVLFTNSIQQNHSLSISGGSEKASFYASIGFLHDPGWTISDKVDRFTSNMNATVKLNDYIDLNLTSNNSVRMQQVPGSLDRELDPVSGTYNRNFDINPFSYSLNSSRTMDDVDDNGNNVYYNRNYAPFSILDESQYNYISLDYLDTKIQAELTARPFRNVTLTALGALRYVKTTREHKIEENSNMANAYRAAYDATIRENNPFLYDDPDNPTELPQVVLPEGGFYNRDDNTMLNYYVRATAGFNRLFGDKHNVNVLLGQEVRYADRTYSFNNGFGFQWNKGGVPFVDYRIIKQMIEGGFQYYGMNRNYDRFAAFFGTGGYSFDERYTINLTARYDGSNRLGKSRAARWLPTWNISGAWHILNEGFMESQDFFSTLNLRATYGLTASMGPASNAAVVYMNEISYRPYQYEKENQIVLADLENSELTWEKQYETNIGVDVGILKNRLSLSTDIYRRDGFDLIGYVLTSGTGGEYYKAANYADMTSSGIEFTLNGRIIQNKDFKWSGNVTFSYNTNEITRLGSTPRVIDLITEGGGPAEGYPVRGLFSIPFVGLDSEGLPLVIDESGRVSNEGVNFQSRNTDYLKYEGPVDPPIVGGFNNTLSYKRFTLNVYLTYQAGNKIRLSPSFSSQYSDIYAMTRDMLNRWMMPGDELVTDIPAVASARQLNENPYLVQAYNAYNYSSARIADGGFIRLKDIILSYKIPTKTRMEVKLTASNICLLYSDKKLNGQDPEFFRTGGVAMPVPRQFTLTYKVGF